MPEHVIRVFPFVLEFGVDARVHLVELRVNNLPQEWMWLEGHSTQNRNVVRTTVIVRVMHAVGYSEVWTS